jgi:rod shape-determining protein MreC
VSYRDGPFNDLKVPLTWTAAIAVVVAIVVAAALLFSDRRETLRDEAYSAGKKVFDAADRPVSSVTAAPARWTGAFGGFLSDYLFAVSENRRLKQELSEMRHWRDAAIAQDNVNRRLTALLGMKTNPPIPTVAGRVVMDSRGPFSNTRLSDIGVEDGIAIGNPVVNDRGMVGRIVGVTHGASRILLLTDIASRQPVLVDRTDARAIMIGDGGPNPRLAYLRGQNPVKEGDRVLSSGDGGVIPRGLPVGVAAKGLDGQWRVRLYADQAAIDFVRVLKFRDFSTLVKVVELDRPAAPPPPTNETAQPTIVIAPPKPLPAAAQPAISVSPGTILAPAPGAVLQVPATPRAQPPASATQAHPKAPPSVKPTKPSVPSDAVRTAQKSSTPAAAKASAPASSKSAAKSSTATPSKPVPSKPVSSKPAASSSAKAKPKRPAAPTRTPDARVDD